MTKKHINDLTLQEIDYAVAVAQGWELRGDGNNYWHNGINFIYGLDNSCIGDYYHPTTNQEQCGNLIDEFKITCRFSSRKDWCAWMDEDNNSIANRDKSRLVAACKAFLWSKYPDGMVEVDCV